MRKELEVVGGVKSWPHCRCHTADSIPSHPTAATIYMSIPPAWWRVRSTSTAPFCRTVVIYDFSFLFWSSHFSFTSSCQRRLTQEGQRSAGWWVGVEGGQAGGGGWRWGGVGALSLPSQAERWTGRKEGRRDSPCEELLFMWRDLEQPEASAVAQIGCCNWRETQFTQRHVNFYFAPQNKFFLLHFWYV